MTIFPKLRRPFWVVALVIALGLTASVTMIISSPAAQNDSLQPYHSIALNSELIVLGNVENIEFTRGLFGFSGDEPQYITYQYITLESLRVIKGTPRVSPIVFKATQLLHDPTFKLGDEIIVMLKWYSDELYGQYYSPGMGSGGRAVFYVHHVSGNDVVSSPSMGDGWKASLDEFLSEITDTQ